MVRLCTLHVTRKHHNIFLAPRLTTIQRAWLDCTGREARSPSMNPPPRPSCGTEPATATQQQLSVHSAPRRSLAGGLRATSCTRPSGVPRELKDTTSAKSSIEPPAPRRDAFGTLDDSSRSIAQNLARSAACPSYPPVSRSRAEPPRLRPLSSRCRASGRLAGSPHLPTRAGPLLRMSGQLSLARGPTRWTW